jgi:hypothetical protein
MNLFGRPRHRRRHPRDPAKQVGNAVGKVISTVLVGAITSFFRKK